MERFAPIKGKSRSTLNQRAKSFDWGTDTPWKDANSDCNPVVTGKQSCKPSDNVLVAPPSGRYRIEESSGAPKRKQNIILNPLATDPGDGHKLGGYYHPLGTSAKYIEVSNWNSGKGAGKINGTTELGRDEESCLNDRTDLDNGVCKLDYTPTKNFQGYAKINYQVWTPDSDLGFVLKSSPASIYLDIYPYPRSSPVERALAENSTGVLLLKPNLYLDSSATTSTQFENADDPNQFKEDGPGVSDTPRVRSLFKGIATGEIIRLRRSRS